MKKLGWAVLVLALLGFTAEDSSAQRRSAPIWTTGGSTSRTDRDGDSDSDARRGRSDRDSDSDSDRDSDSDSDGDSDDGRARDRGRVIDRRDGAARLPLPWPTDRRDDRRKAEERRRGTIDGIDLPWPIGRGTVGSLDQVLFLVTDAGERRR